MDLNLERGAALRRTHRDAGMKEQNDRAADVLSRRRAGSRSDRERLELRICALAAAVAAVGIAAAVAIKPSTILRTFARRRQLVHVVIAEIAGTDEKGGELNEWHGGRPDWLNTPAVCNIESWKGIQPLSALWRWLRRRNKAAKMLNNTFGCLRGAATPVEVRIAVAF